MPIAAQRSDTRDTGENLMTINKSYTRTYPSVGAIKQANRDAGQHFFDADTLRFFDSRIGKTVIGNRYFITSEQFHGSDGTVDARRYTVRIADNSGRIDTIGEFQEWSTAAAARAAALVAASFGRTS